MKGKKSVVPWKPFLRLIPFVSLHGFWLLFGIFLAFCQVCLNIAFAYLTKNMTDFALNLQLGPFLDLVYLALALVVAMMVVIYLGKYAVIRYKTLAIRDLRNHITHHLQQLPIPSFENYHTGDLISRLNTDLTQVEIFLERLPHHLYQPLLFVGAFTYMLFISWKLLLATFILIPLAGLVFNKISQPIENLSRQLRTCLAQANAVSQDTISGIATVKAFNSEEIPAQKYQALVKQVEVQGIHMARVDAGLKFVEIVLSFTPQLILPLYGGYLMVQDDLTVGGLLAAMTLIWYIFLPAEAFLGLLRNMRETVPSLERLLGILDLPTEHVPRQARQLKPDAVPLTMTNVSFGYDEGGKILNDLSLSLARNKTVALVGPSGGGKSTVLKLLCGFYKPQSGRITLFGSDIHRADPSTVRAQIALMSQDTYLFPTTVAENIAYGRLGATEKEIIAAAKAANAHSFIVDLPQGYDTLMGERGSRLSGGQRQRIALARTILKNAPILLLDEPTSALDTEAEKLVEEALTRLLIDRTVLVVAHRLSTIRGADKVLVLEQGRLVETGTHAELMTSDSLYKKLYLKQAVSTEAHMPPQEGEVGND